MRSSEGVLQVAVNALWAGGGPLNSNAGFADQLNGLPECIAGLGFRQRFCTRFYTSELTTIAIATINIAINLYFTRARSVNDSKFGNFDVLEPQINLQVNKSLDSAQNQGRCAKPSQIYKECQQVHKNLEC